MSFPKRAKKWKGLPFCDLIADKFEFSPFESNVFKSLWKAWEVVKHYIRNNECFKNNNCFSTNRSIWWNIVHKDKPLATL